MFLLPESTNHEATAPSNSRPNRRGYMEKKSGEVGHWKGLGISPPHTRSLN